MQTYLFYDIETTGLNKAFDQVLHFAAIRTTLALEEIERYELKVKLNSDVIPSPGAMMTHHISMAESLQGVTELDAIQQIHRWMNTSGTISVGYNTLGFDDEFLRFSFFRNLFTPYTHQFANQCGRMDLYPITVIYFLYKNDIIRWPTQEGKTSLKLEKLNTENQLAAGRAHHAMVDVEATVALAKRFYQSREMWDFVIGYFTKQADQERFQQLPNLVSNDFREGLMIYGKLGAALSYQAPALYIGDSKPYKGQGLWLRLDTENLMLTTPDTIADNTWVMRKKFGEPPIVLPPKQRFLTALSRERIAQTEANKKWLLEHPELFQQIVNYHRNYTYPAVPNVDVEASLYLNGFWTEDELQFCRRFHQATPSEKAQLTQNIRNARLTKLATRILGRHFPDVLTEPQKEEFEAYLQQLSIPDVSIVDYKGNYKLTPQLALQDINERRQQTVLSVEQKTLLDALEKYLLEKL